MKVSLDLDYDEAVVLRADLIDGLHPDDSTAEKLVAALNSMIQNEDERRAEPDLNAETGREREYREKYR